jgi:hypothetical protein
MKHQQNRKWISALELLFLLLSIGMIIYYYVLNPLNNQYEIKQIREAQPVVLSEYKPFVDYYTSISIQEKRGL